MDILHTCEVFYGAEQDFKKQHDFKSINFERRKCLFKTISFVMNLHMPTTKHRYIL